MLPEALGGASVNILLVNKFWKPAGGVEVHAVAVRKLLESRGHSVLPFAVQDPDNYDSPIASEFISPVEMRSENRLEQARAVARAMFGVETIRKIRKVVRDENIDAVHVLHAYHQLGVSFMRMLANAGVPVVLSLHDYKIGCPNYRFFNENMNTLCTICLDHRFGFVWAPTVKRCWDGSRTGGFALTLEATAQKAIGSYSRGPGAVVVLNDLQRRSVISAGVSPERIFKVPHFVDPALIDSGRLHRDRHVLFVGRLVPEKGISTLIRACARASVELRIVGEGRLKDDLKALVVDLGADVEFLGSLLPSEVASEMRRAQIVAVPSEWHEVSPLVVLEAMAHGTPVIGTQLGGLPEMLGDGRGVIVPAGDVEAWSAAIRDAFTDPSQLGDTVRLAQAWLTTELTVDRWIERMQGAYAAAGVKGTL